jgi:hypothetical protein
MLLLKRSYAACLVIAAMTLFSSPASGVLSSETIAQWAPKTLSTLSTVVNNTLTTFTTLFAHYHKYHPDNVDISHAMYDIIEKLQILVQEINLYTSWYDRGSDMVFTELNKKYGQVAIVMANFMDTYQNAPHINEITSGTKQEKSAVEKIMTEKEQFPPAPLVNTLGSVQYMNEKTGIATLTGSGKPENKGQGLNKGLDQNLPTKDSVPTHVGTLLRKEKANLSVQQVTGKLNSKHHETIKTWKTI